MLNSSLCDSDWDFGISLFCASNVTLLSWVSRHPALVSFLGAWSTKRLVLDKQEQKAETNEGRNERATPSACFENSVHPSSHFPRNTDLWLLNLPLACKAYVVGIELCGTNLEDVLQKRKEMHLGQKKRQSTDPLNHIESLFVEKTWL